MVITQAPQSWCQHRQSPPPLGGLHTDIPLLHYWYCHCEKVLTVGSPQPEHALESGQSKSFDSNIRVVTQVRAAGIDYVLELLLRIQDTHSGTCRRPPSRTFVSLVCGQVSRRAVGGGAIGKGGEGLQTYATRNQPIHLRTCAKGNQSKLKLNH